MAIKLKRVPNDKIGWLDTGNLFFVIRVLIDLHGIELWGRTNDQLSLHDVELRKGGKVIARKNKND